MTLTTTSGRPASALGFGCSRVGSLGNATPLDEVRRVMAAALDRGINVFDTADIYGQGDSEREVGRVVGVRRADAIVVTKVGLVFSSRMRAIAILKPVLGPLVRRVPPLRNRIVRERGGQMAQDFNPARIGPALDASLRRLRTPFVDILLLHSPPSRVVTDPEVHAALSACRVDGRARRIGVACDDLETLEAALSWPDLDAVEVTLDTLDEATAAGVGAELHRREVAVIGREVIRRRAGLAPRDAVSAAIARDDVAVAVVGVSRLSHLDDLWPSPAAPTDRAAR